MKIASKIMMATGAVALIGLVGCAGPSRDAMAKEYERLASLPPVYVNHCPEDRALDSLGVSVSESYNFAHKLMKEYVTATETHRAYISFMNEVDYLMKTEKLEQQAAINKVAAIIQAEDAKISDPNGKKWPQIVAGIAAANALDPVKKLAEMAPVTVSILKAIDDCKHLKHSFRGFDPATVRKGICAGKIISQATTASECLAFLGEQYRRVLKAKYFLE